MYLNRGLNWLESFLPGKITLPRVISTGLGKITSLALLGMLFPPNQSRLPSVKWFSLVKNFPALINPQFECINSYSSSQVLYWSFHHFLDPPQSILNLASVWIVSWSDSLPQTKLPASILVYNILREVLCCKFVLWHLCQILWTADQFMKRVKSKTDNFFPQFWMEVKGINKFITIYFGHN